MKGKQFIFNIWKIESLLDYFKNSPEQEVLGEGGKKGGSVVATFPKASAFASNRSRIRSHVFSSKISGAGTVYLKISWAGAVFYMFSESEPFLLPDPFYISNRSRSHPIFCRLRNPACLCLKYYFISISNNTFSNFINPTTPADKIKSLLQ